MSSQKEVPGLQLENINVTRHGHHLDITLVNMTLNQLLLLVNWLELRVFKWEDLCFVFSTIRIDLMICNNFTLKQL